MIETTVEITGPVRSPLDRDQEVNAQLRRVPGAGLEPAQPVGSGGLSSITQCPPTYLVVRLCRVRADQANQRTSAGTGVSGRINVRNETTIETTKRQKGDFFYHHAPLELLLRGSRRTPFGRARPPPAEP